MLEQAASSVTCLQRHRFLVPIKRECVEYGWCAAASELRCVRPFRLDGLTGVRKRGGWMINLTAARLRGASSACHGRIVADSPQAQSGCAESAAPPRPVYVGFLHLDKCGGTSLRQWFKALELDDASWQFISAYTSGTCLLFSPEAGIARCSSIQAQRDHALVLLNRSMAAPAGGGAGVACGEAAGARRLLVEFHAQDAPQLASHARQLEAWRRPRAWSANPAANSAANPDPNRGGAPASFHAAAPTVLIVCVVREPHEWYISMVAYMRAMYGQYGRLSLEEAVHQQPNGQCAKLERVWKVREMPISHCPHTPSTPCD